MTVDLPDAIWRKSSRSQNNGACIEVADAGDRIAVRDSKNPGGPVLVFTAFEWECFVDGVEHGEFRRG